MRSYASISGSERHREHKRHRGERNRVSSFTMGMIFEDGWRENESLEK